LICLDLSGLAFIIAASNHNLLLPQAADCRSYHIANHLGTFPQSDPFKRTLKVRPSIVRKFVNEYIEGIFVRSIRLQIQFVQDDPAEEGALSLHEGSRPGHTHLDALKVEQTGQFLNRLVGKNAGIV